jgi:hypothetical protein
MVTPGSRQGHAAKVHTVDGVHFGADVGEMRP